VGLLIVNFLPIVCGECLALHLCSKINFLSKRQFSQEILLLLEDKTKYFYVLPMLVECHFIMSILIFECQKGHMMCTIWS
jgi:hypothetical protein